MNNNYDVIIVGAGNSGLTAAITTAQAGLNTLLIEQHFQVGGVGGSVVRGRFEFEKSLHELSGYSCDSTVVGPVSEVMEKLGVHPHIVMAPEAYRVITMEDGADNVDVTIPFGGLDNVMAAIEAYMPGSRRYTEPFFSLLTEAHRGLNSRAPMPQKCAENPHFLRLSTMTLLQVEEELKIPNKLRAILDAYWCYDGIPSDQVSFLYYSTMCYTYFTLGGTVAVQRSTELNQAFQTRFLACGGTLLCNTLVRKILVRDGAAFGVETERGTFYAKKIITDVNRHIVYGRLIDFEQIPERAVRQANSRDVGVRPFVVELGLNRSCEALGLKNYNTFIYPSYDPKRCDEAMRAVEGNKAIAAVCINAAIPDASPEGTCILFLTTMLKPGELLDTFNAENVEERTQAVARQLIEQAEHAMGVSVQAHIEEIFVASPLDVAGNMQAYDGIMYGYEQTVSDCVMIRAFNLDKDNCIKNLLFAGATAQNGHGYGATIRIGNIMGERAIAQIKEESK